MKVKKKLIISIILTIFLFTLINISEAGINSDYIIDGNSVYIEDDYVFLNATPHTLHYSDWVELDFESKVYSGDIDFAFGFNTDSVRPSAIQLWKNTPQTIQTEHSYTCEHDFNYTLDPNHFWCFWDTVNGTELIFDHSFLRGNLQEKTAYWNTSYETNWYDWSNHFSKTSFDFDGKDTWYYVTNQNINEDTRYKVRYYLNVNSSAQNVKYDIAFKRSSDTFSEAIANDRFYLLDPFVSATLNDGLIAYYTMDDSSIDGTTVADWTNQGRNGSLNQTYITGIQGKFRQGIFIDGNPNEDSGGINITDDAQLRLLSGGTINMWINISGVMAGGRFFSKSDGSGQGVSGYACYMNSSNCIECYYNGFLVGTTEGDLTGFTNFVMLTVLLNEAPSPVQIFVNGTNFTSTRTLADVPDSSAYFLMLGGRPYATDNNKRGIDETIDEVGIWNRILSYAEIQELWNNGGGLLYASVVTENGTTTEVENLGNKTKAYVEFEDSDYNASYVNFTIKTPNGTIRIENANGTRQANDGDRVNWTTDEFLADFNGTWTWNATISYIDGLLPDETISSYFLVHDTIPPNISITLPTGADIEGSTPHSVPLNISVNDSTVVRCFYDIPAEHPSELNVSMTVVGNSSALYTANATATISAQATRRIDFYCNDTAGNIGNNSITVTTKASTVTPPTTGGGGSPPTPVSEIVCEEGEDLYWKAETSRGGISQLKFIAPLGDSKEKITIQNLGLENVTIDLQCSPPTNNPYNVCSMVELSEDSIYLAGGETKSIEVFFDLTQELSEGDDIWFFVNVKDDKGEAGCDGKLTFTYRISTFFGTLYTWDLISTIIFLAGLLISIFSLRGDKKSGKLRTAIIFGAIMLFTFAVSFLYLLLLK